MMEVTISATDLKELVENAFREGYQEGRGGGWVCGHPWQKSEAKRDLSAVIAPKFKE